MDAAAYLQGFIYSTIATCFFGFIFRAPVKTIPISAIAGGAGWVLLNLLDRTLLSYFIAATAVTVFGELCARFMKKPATSFLYVMVVPMVPGVSLYRTMLHVVSGHTQEGIEMGAYTMLSIGMIAMAIGFTSLMFRRFARRIKRIG